MHDTALELGRLFFERYLPKDRPVAILDIGSLDVNGSLRQALPPDCDITYTGVDLAKGPGVDFVVDSTGKLPFDGASFDVVVSTSCFEHDPCFWATFEEAVRVLKPGGFLYLNAPSNGVVHQYPLDCWRFYPDAGVALAAWVNRELSHHPVIELLESFTHDQREHGWNDTVLVFGKLPRGLQPEPLATSLDGAKNVRRSGVEGVERFEPMSEDQRKVLTFAATSHHFVSVLRAETEEAISIPGGGRPLISVIVHFDALTDEDSLSQCFESAFAPLVEPLLILDDHSAGPSFPFFRKGEGENYFDCALRVANGLYLLEVPPSFRFAPGALDELTASLRAEPMGALYCQVPGEGGTALQLVLRTSLARAYHRAGKDLRLIPGELGSTQSPIVLGRLA